MNVGAFDIETTQWDQFVCGGILDASGDVSIYWDELDCFRAVADYDGVLWTWAGGRYDMVWIYSVAKMLGIRCEARLSGGQIVSLSIGRATIRDGFKLYPVPLAVAAEFGGERKLETGFPCHCGSDCGGYCRINRKMARADRQRLASYLEGDLQATAGVISALHEFAEIHDIELKSTVGSSAWATLREMGAPDAKWRSVRDYMFARLGYYGGRTEIYDTRRLPVIWNYDINSAYPAALRDYAVPTGGYRRHTGAAARTAYNAGKPGIYAARVKVPDMRVPPLPNRGRDRLVFVTGEQIGHWTGVELHAAEATGTRVLDITESITWDTEEKVAAPFMEKFWGLRAHYGKKSPQGAWLKWFVNSLTGKLAMRPEGERLIGSPEASEIKSCPGARNNACFGVLCGTVGCCPHRCTETCGKWQAIDRDASIYVAPTFALDKCAHVHWSATLTAHTRISLGAKLREADDAAVLCDTDSVKATRELFLRNGKDLGQWHFEGLRADHWGPFPKAYRNADPETGEYDVRAKGVPYLDAITFDRWAAGGVGVQLDRGVWGIKGGARKGPVFQRRDITRWVRASGRTVGSRLVLEDGRTRALSFAEYKKIEDNERMKGKVDHG